MITTFSMDFALVLIVGLAISLLCSEIFGISPGGIITPVYLAMVCDDIKIVVFIFLIAAVTYAIVSFAQRHIILYGRRKFVFTMVVAVTLRTILSFVYPFLPYESLILRGIGVVVPALLANQFSKQGVTLTTVASVGTTIAVVLVVNVLYFAGL